MILRFLTQLLLCFYTGILLFAQESQWHADYGKSKDFIANHGQYDAYQNDYTGKIEYAADLGATKFFFGKKGMSIYFLEAQKKSAAERDAIAKLETKSIEEHKSKEKLYGKFLFREDRVNIKWVNSLATTELDGLEKNSAYHSFAVNDGDNKMSNYNFVPSYKKLVYRNIYPHIDIEYSIHPESGIKYAFILNPGANPELIKSMYDRDIKLIDGKISIQTLFGGITDHEPISFYSDNQDVIIESGFNVKGNEVSFFLENYDNSKKVIIDPWLQTPTFATNWDCVWECERDATGNVYLIGGIMPMQLLKYSSAGALQWTYNTPYDTSNCWLGTFATDLAGNSYVTRGSVSGIQKIATNGALTWNNNGGGGSIGNSDEYWNIAFNCDQSGLIVGGTSGAFAIPPLLEASIFYINTSNGNYTNVVDVAVGPAATFPPIEVQEVRSITAAPNGKYYWLTQDTIGFINDDPGFCTNNPISFFKTGHGADFGYKSENYRYNNTGIMSIRADENAVYMHRGDQLQKRSLVDLSLISSVAIPSGGYNSVFLGGNQVSNSGIDIDQCGNIYVGSTNGVYKFNSSLVQQAFYTTTFIVYDVNVSISGEIVACGGTGNSSSSNRSGGIQVFAASACAPLAASCCDPSFCVPLAVCNTEAPFSLNPATPGGTWSGPGVNASGVFDPSITGTGVFNITYQLACGSETIAINVIPCSMEICIETNGDFTISGGTAPYAWSSGTIIPPSSITSEAECIACADATPQYFGTPPFAIYLGCDISTCPQDTAWTQYATGSTTTAPSSYPIQVVDANGTTIVLSNASTLLPCSANPCSGVTISMNIIAQTNVTCAGGNNGSATVSATGGNAPYNYTWMPGSLNGNTQSGLSASVYNINITDNSGCTGSGTVTISEPTALVLTTSTTDANCGVNDGTATANVSGGVPGYTYSWSPSGGNGATANGLGAGVYTVTVSDQNGCSTSAQANVSNTNAPVVSVSIVSSPSCFGALDGSLSSTVTGGAAPYTYSWSPSGGNGSSASNLGAGTYTLTVTGNDGCVTVATVTLTEPSQILISESITDENCGQNDGAISVVVTGGTPVYTYEWAPNGESTSSISNLSGGNYSLTVTDDSGCSTSENYQVAIIGSIPVTASPNYSTITEGESVQLNSFGAVDYTWSPSGGLSCVNCADPVASPSITTTYIVTGTDAFGCAGTDTVTIYVTLNCADLFIPTVFSPNGNGPGANETLCVFGNCVSELKFKIFNRWGQMVFETETPFDGTNSQNEICWDGTYRGKAVQSGVYVYTVYAQLFNGEVVETSGNITVLR